MSLLYKKQNLLYSITVFYTKYAIAGTNTTYLSNTINDYYKCNFRTLINSYRVKRAKEILLNDSSYIKDIHKKCGFASLSVFYQVFVEKEGIPPLQFKKKKNVKKKKRISEKVQNKSPERIVLT